MYFETNARMIGGYLLGGLVILVCFLAHCHSASANCGNESLRVEQRSTALPDCRGYEMVTPVGKDSDEPKAVIAGLDEPELDSPEGMHTSISGDRMAWTSEYVFPGSQSPGLNYLSTRGATGWSTENVIPRQSIENGLDCPGWVAMAAYSSELSTGVLADGYGQIGSFKGESLDCGHDEPLLVSGEPLGFQNLFLRDNELASYKLINVTPPDAPAPSPAPENDNEYFPAAFLAGSDDLSHVVFEEELPLVEGAGSGDELYDYSGGAVHLVTYLPGGTSVHGTLAGSTPNTSRDEATQEFVPFNIANYIHAVSGDGSRVFFDAEGGLYARTNVEQPPVAECTSSGSACTVQLDQAQGGATGTSGGGKFMLASENGERAFFTDESRLTPDSNAESGQPDLYEYSFERPQGERLLDLTTGSGGPAAVLGVSGASENGDEVYFVAEAVLTGSQQGADGLNALPAHPNLYVTKEGRITFIASLDQNADFCDWQSPTCLSNPSESGGLTGGFGGLTTRVSGNGTFLTFESDLSLTGYRNEGPACVALPESTVPEYGAGDCQEVFLYDARDNKLECASCDPSGAPPVGPAFVRYPSPASQGEMRNSYPQRYVSETGQVFFESRDPLVPTATNGQLNVYEYEHGEPLLISGGTSGANSYFLDASPDGDNVFFATAYPLLKSDDDASYDIYDARVEGGFPEARAGATCQGEECMGPIIPPQAVSVPVTVDFSEPPSPPVVEKAIKKAKTKTKKKKKKKRSRRHVVKTKHSNKHRKTKRGTK
jgi:hypothetical protein